MAANLSVTLKMVDQISQKLEEIAGKGDSVAGRFDSLGDRANNAFDKATSGAEKLDEAMSGASEAASEYAENGGKAQQSLEEMANSAADAAEEVNEFGDEAEEAGDQSQKMGEKASKSIIDIGDALAAAGIAVALHEIADAYFACDDAADAFETSMAKVSTIADTSAVSLGTLESDIKKLSNETGIAAKDLAESIYGAISASVDSAEAVAFVGQANSLAVGGFTDSAKAVDVLTTALNAYGMEVDQTSRVSDILIQTQNLGKTTVDQLAASLGMVIPTAAAYNVNLENLAASYAVLTQNGINTANATTNLNAMFAELSNSGSSVAKVLRDQTGKSFADLMEEGYSLGDVMDILGDSVNKDSVAFGNLWSSAVASRGAITLFNSGIDEFNNTLTEMEQSAGAADAAFEKMAGTGEYVQQKWDNALNNLKIAIGDALPSLDGFMEKGASIMQMLSEYVEENPYIVKATVAVTSVLAVFAGGLLAASVGVKALTVATGYLHTALLALEAHPILLLITGITALTALIWSFSDSMEGAEKVEDRLTASSQTLSDEIDRQESKVAYLSRKYGEYSNEVIAAKADLEDMRSELEATGQTIGELNKRIESHTEAWRASAEAYQEHMSSIGAEQTEVLILAEKLERLTSTGELNEAQLKMEGALVDEINRKYPELGLQYDSVTGKLNKSSDAMREFAKEQAEAAREAAKRERYVELIGEQAQAEMDLQAQQETVNMLEAEYNALLDERNSLLVQNMYNADYAKLSAQIVEAGSALDEQKGILSDIQGEYDGLTRQVNQYEDALVTAAEAATREAEGQINTTEELKSAMAGIFQGIDEPAQAMAEAYKNAFTEARGAVESFAGLFETVKIDSSTKANEITGAWKSQTDALTTYSENLKKANDLKFNPQLLQSLADGSQESAGKLQSLINEVDKLKEKGGDVEGFVKEINTSFEELSKAKDTLAQTMTDMNTELQTGLDELQLKMEGAVEKLNLEADAKSAAEATINAYIAGIKTNGQQAVSAAQAVANSVAAALNKATLATQRKAGAQEHALGTTYGENVYIAGEYGPELIVGREGSEVFPASETAKILNAVMNNKENDAPAPPTETIYRTYHEEKNSSTNSEQQTLNINLSGKGSLDVNGGAVSMSKIGEYVASNIEGWIMQIAAREIYEEGEVAHEF